MTGSYGAIRVLMRVLTQWRDGIFARVAMHAVRKLAYLTSSTCRAVAALSPRAQDRRLTRVLERGRLGIEVIVRMVICNSLRPLYEVSLLMGVLLWQFRLRYVLVTMITADLHVLTYVATECESKISPQR